MFYGLFWVLCAATRILAVALAAAASARLSRRFWQLIWPLAAASILLAAGVGWTAFAWHLRTFHARPGWFFPYTLSLTLAYLIGAGIVLNRGFRSGGTLPAARSWPRMRLFLALVLLLVLSTTLFFLRDLDMRAELRMVQAESVAKAIDIYPSRPNPAENAFGLYDQAGRRLGSPADLPGWFSETADPDFNPTPAEVTDFLADKQEALRLLHQAAPKPYFHFSVDAHNLIEAAFPIRNIIDLARLLALDARSKALSGDGLPAAIRDLQSLAAMSRHLQSLPLLITFIQAVAVEKIRVSTLEYVMAYTEASTADLVSAGMPALPMSPPPSIKDDFFRALRMEEATFLQLFETANSAEGVGRLLVDADPGSLGTAILPVWRVFLLPSDIEATRRRWGELLGVMAGGPYHRVHSALRRWESSVADDPGGVLTSLALARFSPHLVLSDRLESLRRLSVLAVAVRAYQAEHGHYPARQKDMIPRFLTERLLDPFDGEPLKMRVVNGGLDLYSVGPEPDEQTGFPGSQGPQHIYLGREAFEEFRVKPARQDKAGK